MQDTCEICGASPTTEHDGHHLCGDCVTAAITYEQKLQARYDRLKARTEKAAQEAEAEFTRARGYVEHIPMGQPILVGHHSERKHRRALEQHDSAMRRGIAAQKRAQELARRQQSTAISSDDPTAILQLRDKIAKAEAAQTTMKAANKTLRKHLKVTGDWQKRELVGDVEAAVAALMKEHGFSEKNARLACQMDFLGRIGFADYQLSNNNAEIRRLKERLVKLEQRQAVKAALEAETGSTTEEEQHGDIRLVRDHDANRLRLYFPGKPSQDTIKLLKARGFRWSPTEGAWQRQISNGANYDAQYIIQKVNGA